MALDKAKIKGPYVLFAHSMSAIESIYWAQTYPEEVLAIVGLDMAVPITYDTFDYNKTLLNLSAFWARIWITRFLPGVVNDSAAIKAGRLTNAEKKLYKAVFYQKTMTKAKKNEIIAIKDNV